MRIERDDETGPALVAIFDAAEQSALSRSADQVPGWLADCPDGVRGILRRTGDAIVGHFPDAAGLRAFLDRFLPGKLRDGGDLALGLASA